MPLRRPLLIMAAAAALVSGCSASTLSGHGTTAGSGLGSSGAPSRFPSGSSTASGGSSATTATFGECGDVIDTGQLSYPSGRRQNLEYSCATIKVPLDYSAPTGPMITLQLVRVHDTQDSKPVGQLLMNPGGPGGSGISLAVNLSAAISDDILTHFDLIGFDPRGVGRSTPISCLSDAQKDVLNAASPNVLTAAGFAQAKKLSQQVASACSSKYGKSLAQFDTTATARDMDRIRQAVGDPRMNYLGFSYGTELGAAYAHLFPKTIRVMVLDGAVNPLTDPITSFADQLKGFEDAFDQFATWCKSHSPCSSLGDARQAVYRIAAAATKRPIPSSNSGETRRATSSIVYTGVLSALYSQQEWPLLGESLIAAGRGDAQGIFLLADNYNERVNGHYTNISEANTTINCNDSEPGPSDATILATAKSWVKRFPIFGAWSAPALFSCQQWQPDRTPLPLPTAPTSVKVLVVGNLHDPATPYQGAKDLARTMGNAELLTWDGEGHTSYLQGSSCIDQHVDDYLVNVTLPPADTVCPR